MKFGQYAPNGCEVTVLSNDWNESYCYRCISTFQLFKYPQKLDDIIWRGSGKLSQHHSGTLLYPVSKLTVNSDYKQIHTDMSHVNLCILVLHRTTLCAHE